MLLQQQLPQENRRSCKHIVYELQLQYSPCVGTTQDAAVLASATRGAVRSI
jgi:hypothetical protein